MSQITQEVTVTNTYTRIVSTSCELCRTRTTGDDWMAKPGENVMDIKISLKHGWGYGGDGGQTEEIIYDICPQCFTNKLETWLKEQGARPRVVEHDW